MTFAGKDRDIVLQHVGTGLATAVEVKQNWSMVETVTDLEGWP